MDRLVKNRGLVFHEDRQDSVGKDTIPWQAEKWYHRFDLRIAGVNPALSWRTARFSSRGEATLQLHIVSGITEE
jgi:hypothetical protein